MEVAKVSHHVFVVSMATSVNGSTNHRSIILLLYVSW